MEKEWKEVAGFEGLYWVSSDGEVKSKRTVLKPYHTKKGYQKVGLFKEGKDHKKRVHRLVAQAFIPNPDNLPQVNHLDGNKDNNNVINLEWCTNADNAKHAWALGLYKSRKRKCE